MQIARYLRPIRIGGVATQLGRMLRLYGVLQLVPAAVSVAVGELATAAALLATSVVCAAVGSLAARIDRHDLALREGLVVTAVSYLLCSVAGAVPYLSVSPPADALFESLSGLTTTGLTVVPLDRLGDGLLFHRAFSQWIGGGGIVVLSLAVLHRTSAAAHRLYASEFGDEPLVGSIVASARVIARVYLVLTAVAVALLTLVGLPPFEAVLYGLSAVSTGGFAPSPTSLSAVPSAAVRAAVAALMFAGAIGFPLYHRVGRGGVRELLRDAQVRGLAVIVVVGGGLTLLAGEATGTAAFHAVSAATTTGFSVSPAEGWSGGARLVAVVLMVVGGAAGSTAGGVKLYRAIVASRMARWLLGRTLLPDEARLAVRYGGEAVGDDDLRQIATVILLYLALLGGSAVALAVAGAPPVDALFESASALGTVGLSSGLTAPDLGLGSKLVLMADMWLGRLEILPVLVVLYPGTWKVG